MTAFKHFDLTSRQGIVTATLVLAVGNAFAQGTVSIYGVADSFVGKASGSSSVLRLGEGGNENSRLGFRGTEDLGGGVTATFLLEAGFNIDNGSGTITGPGLAFTRQSYVGLNSSWGSLLLGRQYTPIFRVNLKSDPFGVNNIFSTNILWAQTDAQTNLTPWSSRMDNAILYSTPGSVPLQATLMYAPGEVADSSSGNYTGANLSWTNGPWWIGYGYQKIMSGSAAAPAAKPLGSTSSLLAVNYEQNPYRFGLSWGQQVSDVAGSAKADILNIHAKYLHAGIHAFTVSYGKRTVENSPRGQQVLTLGYGYILTKRTELYARVLQLNNDANASVTLAQIPINANSGDDGQHYAVGLTHRF